MTPARMAEIHAASFTTPRPWTEAEFTQLLADPAILFAEAAEGFAIGRVVIDEAEVLTIAVDPEARGRGIGARLLGDLLIRLEGAGATTVHLEVAADNSAARALYATAGFAESGRRKGYYQSREGTRIDALVMRRSASTASVKI